MLHFFLNTALSHWNSRVATAIFLINFKATPKMKGNPSGALAQVQTPSRPFLRPHAYRWFAVYRATCMAQDVQLAWHKMYNLHGRRRDMIGLIRSRTDFTGTYRRHVMNDRLDALLPALPALLLDGPKGVG